MNDLAQVEMNGIEIGNAIITARQLTEFKKIGLSYRHLEHVVRINGKFSKYLKYLGDGLTEDKLKREGGLRFTYKAKTKDGLFNI